MWKKAYLLKDLSLVKILIIAFPDIGLFLPVRNANSQRWKCQLIIDVSPNNM